VVRTASTITLDRTVCVQIISDPDFYSICPSYADLKRMGMDLYEKYLALSNPATCGSCDKNNRKTLDPIVAAFLLRTKELHEQGKSNELVDYMTARCGFVPLQVVMYHKSEEGLNRILLKEAATDG